MRKEKMKRNSKSCPHGIIGYPPNSKRRYRFMDSSDTWTCYSCYAGKTLDVDITVLNKEDIEAGLDRCKYCRKKLVPKKERVTYIECGWCGEKICI